MWQWLEFHGVAVQAAGAVVSAIIGTVTIPVLLMTYFAARQAAHAASEQAAAARILTAVSQAQQVAAERAAVAAEAQVASAEASGALARQQLAAVQESAAAERVHSELIRQQTLASLRPVLALVIRFSSHVSWTVLENQSGALALDVTAWNGTLKNPGKPIAVSQATLAAGIEARIEGVDWGAPDTNSFGEAINAPPVPIFVLYRSQDGRSFHTVVENLRSSPLSQTSGEDGVSKVS